MAMTTKRKKSLAIVASLLLGLLGTLVFISGVNSTKTVMVDVVVARETILRGDIFTDANTDTIQVAENRLVDGTATKKEEIVNKFASRDLNSGDTIRLAYAGESQTIRNVSEGMTKINVAVTPQTQGGVIPGDRVDIVAMTPSSYSQATLTTPTISKTLARNVKVLSLLYDSGRETQEKEVKKAQATGSDVSATDGGTTGVQSSSDKYPSYVVVEVEPAVAKSILEAMQNKETLVTQYNPWGYETIESLKKALDKLDEEAVKLESNKKATYAEYVTHYEKMLTLLNTLAKENGGVSGEKEFFNKITRSMIQLVSKAPAKSPAENKFVTDKLNELSVILSDLNTGWWTIEDEMKAVQKTIEEKGGQFVLPRAEEAGDNLNITGTQASTTAAQPKTDEEVPATMKK